MNNQPEKKETEIETEEKLEAKLIRPLSIKEFRDIFNKSYDNGMEFFKSLGNIITYYFNYIRENINPLEWPKRLRQWRNRMIYQYGQDNNMETVINVVFQKLKNGDTEDLSQLEWLVHTSNKRKFFNEVDELISQIINHDPPIIQESYIPSFKSEPLGSIQYSVHENNIKENKAYNMTNPEESENIIKDLKNINAQIGVTNVIRIHNPSESISQQINNVENMFKSINTEREKRGDTKDIIHKDSIHIQNNLKK